MTKKGLEKMRTLQSPPVGKPVVQGVQEAAALSFHDLPPQNQRHLLKQLALFLPEVAAGPLREECLRLLTQAYVFRRLAEQLERETLTDHLTGVLNRKGMLLMAAALYRSVLREGGFLGCFYLDIDCFHEFNLQYGHAAGDEVLTLLGAALQDPILMGDSLAARWSKAGDEFVLILRLPIALEAEEGQARQVLDEQARRVMEGLRRIMADHFAHHSFSFAAVPVDISLGSCLLRPHAGRSSLPATYAAWVDGRLQEMGSEAVEKQSNEELVLIDLIDYADRGMRHCKRITCKGR